MRPLSCADRASHPAVCSPRAPLGQTARSWFSTQRKSVQRGRRQGDGRARGRSGGRLSSWGPGTLIFSHFQRLYFITLPGGASRCLTARHLNLLLLSHLVPVVAVGVFCVIGFYSFLGVPLCPNSGFPSDVRCVSRVNQQWWKGRCCRALLPLPQRWGRSWDRALAGAQHPRGRREGTVLTAGRFCA